MVECSDSVRGEKESESFIAAERECVTGMAARRAARNMGLRLVQVLLVAVVARAPAAHAWRKEGHYMVCKIAEVIERCFEVIVGDSDRIYDELTTAARVCRAF